MKEKSPVRESSIPSAKGERSRRNILTAAANLATTHGLQGLSIGDLAAHLNMSKSGLYAHFKSKEELELATIDTAAEIFEREVLSPAASAPPGIHRLRALADRYLDHLERRVFPGGCFFAAVSAELSTRPGPTRDRVTNVINGWMAMLTQCFEDAKASGEISADADIPQAAFEADAMLALANIMFVMLNDPVPLARARTGINNQLARLVQRGKKGKSM